MMDSIKSDFYMIFNANIYILLSMEPCINLFNKKHYSKVHNDPGVEEKIETAHGQIKRKNVITNVDLEIDSEVVKFRSSPEYSKYIYLIYPDDKMKTKWDMFIVVLVLYTTTIYMYRLAFSDTDTLSWVIFEYILDCFFLIDCVFSFFTCYYDESSQLIVSRKRIAYKYVTSWFFTDIITFFPFEIFSNKVVGINYSFPNELHPLYRTLRILKLFRITKFWSNSAKNQQLEDFLHNFNIKLSRMQYLCISFMLFCHLGCCFWCLLPIAVPGPLNWEIMYNIQDFSDGQQYLAGLYWVITTICTIGYGDIRPTNDLEKAVGICVMSAGVFFFSYTISSITSMMATNSYQNSRIKENSTILQGIANEFKLTKGFKKKLEEALIYNLKETRSDFAAVLNSLPPKVASMLKYAMNHKLVEGNEFFKDKPFHFIQRILEFLIPYKVEAEEYIYREGGPCDEIYFVLNGEVAFVYENNIIYESVGAGGYFGDAEIFLCEERETMVKSLRRTKMLALDREILLSILKDYEKLKVDMIIMSMIKRKQLKKTSIMSNSYGSSQDIHISPHFLFQENQMSSEEISVKFIEDCSSSLEPKRTDSNI